MTTPNDNDNIQKCFEEIKQVLEKYGCNLYTTNDIEIYSDNSFKYYEAEQFNE